MNVLDNHISDIEKRISEICKNAPSLPEASLQESLSSYGWVLLDSWIAWRTLRYLIRNLNISQQIQKKWFQTPSSYTASQLRAAWLFDNNVDSFLENKTDHNLKYLIDEIIQKKRNLSAHFSSGDQVKGNDYLLIRKYFNIFSDLFLIFEIRSFFKHINSEIFNSKNLELQIFNITGQEIITTNDIENITDVDLNRFNIQNISIIKFNFVDANCAISFCINGCWINNDNNKVISHFNIFQNKGFYRDIKVLEEEIKNTKR